MTTIGRRFIDVSALPHYAFGPRDPIWWGLYLLIAIEATMFALLGTSYLYLRGNFEQWPPTGAAFAPLWLTAATVLALIASGIPLVRVHRAAREERLRPIQTGMLLSTIVMFAAVALRAYELRAIGFNWNGHAYGSIVWAIYFMHTFHLVTGAIESAVLTTLLFRGPVEKKLMPDVQLSAVYWWFVIVSWIPFWAVFVMDQR